MAGAAWPRSGRRLPTAPGPPGRRRFRTAGVARPALARAAAGHGAQRPQHGLALIARHGHDLRHQATALATAKALIALALSAEVLPHARPRHGGPVAGNRTSAIQPSRPVTIILRRRVLSARISVTPRVRAAATTAFHPSSSSISWVPMKATREMCLRVDHRRSIYVLDV